MSRKYKVVLVDYDDDLFSPLGFESDQLEIQLNNKLISFYEESCLISNALKEILNSLLGRYIVFIKGGGISSQLELLEKVLYNYLKSLLLGRSI